MLVNIIFYSKFYSFFDSNISFIPGDNNSLLCLSPNFIYSDIISEKSSVYADNKKKSGNLLKYSKLIGSESEIMYSALKPWYVTGLTDAEASFQVQVSQDKKFKTNWRIDIRYTLVLHIKDINLLKNIQLFFGGIGKIRIERENLFVSYTVSSLKELPVIIKHFNSYLLITQKQADFILFEQIFEIMKSKGHLTIDGIHSVIKIKSSMNKGLSTTLKNMFPNVIPVLRPEVYLSKFIDPNWLCGFTKGEGCFGVEIYKSKSKLNYSVTLRFSLNQNNRDHLLISSLVNQFNCGKRRQNLINNATIFYVSDLKNINRIILPFFH